VPRVPAPEIEGIVLKALRDRDLTPRKLSPSQHSVGSEPASCLAAAEACD
jgi:hypothetical protein